MAFRLPYWKKGRVGLWHPAFEHLGIEENELGTGYDDLAELFTWILNSGLIEAHNAWFERGIWTNICRPTFAWPTIDRMTWRCSAAKAAAHALPRALDKAVDAMRLKHQKDTEGEAVMKKMAKPRKPIKRDIVAWATKHAPCRKCGGTKRIPSVKKNGEPSLKGVKCPSCGGLGYDAKKTLPPMPTLWHESRELLDILFDYCKCDVLAEEGLSERIPDLNDAETHAYLMDQIVNERGFRLDREAVNAALDIIAEEFADYNAELAQITEGAVTKASQRQKLVAWFDENGLPLEDTQGATLDAIIDGKSPHPAHQQVAPHVMRVLELVRAMGRSSTAKYETMNDWICPDDRAHGGLLYHGAGTGRWSGAGIQPHNFPKGVFKIKDMTHAWDVLKTRDRTLIESTDYNPKKVT